MLKIWIKKMHFNNQARKKKNSGSGRLWRKPFLPILPELWANIGLNNTEKGMGEMNKKVVVTAMCVFVVIALISLALGQPLVGFFASLNPEPGWYPPAQPVRTPALEDYHPAQVVMVPEIMDMEV